MPAPRTVRVDLAVVEFAVGRRDHGAFIETVLPGRLSRWDHPLRSAAVFETRCFMSDK